MEGKSGYFILYSYDGDAVSDFQSTVIVLTDTPEKAMKIAKKNKPDGWGFRLDTTRGDAGKLNSIDDYRKKTPNSNLEVFGEGKEVPGKMDIKKEAYVDTNSPAFLELNGYFKELVPSIGKSESVAGELVRAINRLLYRYFNDGDQLGIGYGNETCNPAARYLQRYGSHNVRMLVDNMWDENNTDQYEEYLVELVDEINDMVRDNQDLRNKPTPDMFSFKKPEDDQWGDDDYDEGYGDGSEEDEEEYFDEAKKPVVDEEDEDEEEAYYNLGRSRDMRYGDPRGEKPKEKDGDVKDMDESFKVIDESEIRKPRVKKEGIYDEQPDPNDPDAEGNETYPDYEDGDDEVEVKEEYSYEDVENILINALEEASFGEIKSIRSFEQAGVMTYNKGVVVTMRNGQDFQIQINGW